jgi:hypothetical protein
MTLSFRHALQARIGKLPDNPRDPAVLRAFESTPDFLQDDFVREAEKKRGLAWLQGTSLDTRDAMTKALRTGLVTTTEAAIFNALIPRVQMEHFAAEAAAMSDPVKRGETRERYKRLLLSGADSHQPRLDVTFAGAKLQAPVPDTGQGTIDFLYSRVIESKAFDTQAEVDKAMAAPKSINRRTGKPTHMEGTTVFVPGLSNLAPSAAYLFYLARHTDKLVVAYNHPWKDEVVRPIGDTYRGVKVPDALKGKLFVTGSDERIYQPLDAAAGLFVTQLEALRTADPTYGLKAKNLNIVGHSAGNNAVTIARHALAASGHAEIVGRHVALAPAYRGSFSANASGEALAWTLGGRGAKRAVALLAPDTTAKSMDELMSASVDLVQWGRVDDQGAWLMRRTASRADKLERGSDGQIYKGSAEFVKRADRFIESKRHIDHFTMLRTTGAASEWLAEVEPHIDEHSRRFLRALADPK